MKSSIHATGHADLIEAQDGTWWAVCLGIRPVSYPMAHHLGREVYLAPVTWSADGWPIIGNEGHIEPVMNGPKLPEFICPEKPVRDNFNDAKLALEWNFLRNPVQGSWSLEEEPGYLILHGNNTSLDEKGSPAFVGRRLCHFNCKIEAMMEYEPLSDGEEAGLTIYMNERFHYDLAVKTTKGRKIVVFRKTVGSLKVEESRDCPNGPIVLQIQAHPKKFVASIRTSESEMMDIGWGETHFLSTEVAGGFTGVYVAMYATSKTGTSAPVSFDWFDYEPLNLSS
ncbi:Beta-xylosidase [compost metagenome]